MDRRREEKNRNIIEVRKDKEKEKSCFVETKINSLFSRKQETTTSPTRKIGTERIQKKFK